MPFNGSGTFNRYTPGNPAITGTTISSVTYNATILDLANGLSNAITRDGQSVPIANLPMGGFRITGLGLGIDAGDSVSTQQLQYGANTTLTGVAGTNTITGNLSPTIAAYAAGQSFRFAAVASNTGPVTININGLGAKDITKDGANALGAGEIVTGAVYSITYDGVRFQLTGSGGAGASIGGVVFENNITANISGTITTGKNGLSGGPITIADGVTITVPTGSAWSIV